MVGKRNPTWMIGPDADNLKRCCAAIENDDAARVVIGWLARSLINRLERFGDKTCVTTTQICKINNEIDKISERQSKRQTSDGVC